MVVVLIETIEGKTASGLKAEVFGIQNQTDILVGHVIDANGIKTRTTWDEEGKHSSDETLNLQGSGFLNIGIEAKAVFR